MDGLSEITTFLLVVPVGVGVAVLSLDSRWVDVVVVLCKEEEEDISVSMFASLCVSTSVRELGDRDCTISGSSISCSALRDSALENCARWRSG